MYSFYPEHVLLILPRGCIFRFLVVLAFHMSLRVAILTLFDWIQVSSQFSCTVGVDCRLSLFSYGLPATPMVRVSESACGTVSSGSGFQVTGPPSPLFPLGTVPSIVDRLTTLQVCLSSNTDADPTFSVPFGSVDVIGPTRQSSFTCYFGSNCSVTVEGYRLSRRESVVFLTSGNDCTQIPPRSTLFGLSNPRAVLPSSSSVFTYIDFGIVDPSLSIPQTLTLCWSAIGAQGRSQPATVGSVFLTGPTDRSYRAICYMGSLCQFTYTVPVASFFMVSDSTKCEETDHTLRWQGTTNVSTYTSPNLHSLGTANAANGLSVYQAPLCWSSTGTEFLVNVGSFVMVAPQTNDTVFSCQSGLQCGVSVSGVFLSNDVSTLSIRSGSCQGIVAQSTQATHSSDNTTATGLFNPLGFRASDTNLVICWQSGGIPILAGTLVIQGPSVLPGIATCELSSACTIVNKQ
jgi:hypothetical protein